MPVSGLSQGYVRLGVQLTSSKSSIMSWRSERLDLFQSRTVSVATQRSCFSLRQYTLTKA